MAGSRGASQPNGHAHRGARRFLDRLKQQALTTGQPLCLDTMIVIAYVSGNEPVASLIGPLLENGDLDVVVSAITLSEAVARPARAGDRKRVNQIAAALAALPRFHLVDFDRPHALEAAFVRGQTDLKLPDAAIVATARLANAISIVGNDRQWRNKPLGLPYHHMDDLLVLT
jgi:predicted nucleic acid-binding protein